MSSTTMSGRVGFINACNTYVNYFFNNIYIYKNIKLSLNALDYKKQ
jgi:hypothetical protein